MRVAHLPPSPALSKLTQTIRFYKDPFNLLDECHRKLGDLFCLRLIGMGNWVFASDPEHLKTIFKAPPDTLVVGEVNSSILGFMLGPNAIFSLDGDPHFERRKLMQPYFNGKAALSQIDLIRDVTLAELGKCPPGKTFSFGAWSMHTTLAVIMNVLLGALKPHEIEALTQLFSRYSARALRSPLLALPALQLNLGRFSPWGRILALRRETARVFDQVVSNRLAHPVQPGQDVLASMCEWRNEDGEGLSQEAIRDEVMNFLFAGHETTAKILSWSVACALTQPTAMARLRSEIDSVLGGEDIRMEHLRRMPYLLAFLEETRRFRPIGAFTSVRLVKQPFELGDYLLPPGTTIVQGLSLLAKRPDIFEHPEVFEPERFLSTQLKPYSWNPFGGGRRMCTGKGLAEIELAVMLATLLSKFEVKLAQSTIHRVRDGLFFGPSQGLLIEITPRSSG